MTKKKLTANQAAFKKEINRLRDGLRKAQQRGFLPDFNLIPEMPKRVTKKALDFIRKLKPRNIYIKGEWVDKETGEIISAHQRIYQGRPTYPDYNFTSTTVSDYKAEKLAEKLEDIFPETETNYEPVRNNSGVNHDSSNRSMGNDILALDDLAYTILQNLREEIKESLSRPHLVTLMLTWVDLIEEKFGTENAAKAVENISKSFRQWINDSTAPDYEAMVEYQEAFYEEIAKMLPQGFAEDWIGDVREAYTYASVH